MFLLLIASCSVAAATDRPNIVFILADDMSWYGTGAQMQEGLAASAGKTRRTPSINQLAAQGMTFSRAFAPAGICAPSRCSIQTGMTTARTRFTGNGNFGTTSREVTYDGRRNKGRLMLEPSPLGSLNPNQDTIAEYLKPLGYATAHVGKWHVFGGGPGANGYDVHDGATENDDGNPGEAPEQESNPRKAGRPRDPEVERRRQKMFEFLRERGASSKREAKRLIVDFRERLYDDFHKNSVAIVKSDKYKIVTGWLEFKKKGHTLLALEMATYLAKDMGRNWDRFWNNQN